MATGGWAACSSRLLIALVFEHWGVLTRPLRDLFALVSEDPQRLLQHPSASLTALQLFERLPSQPLVTVAQVVDAFQTTKPTAGRAIDALVSAGTLVETTGKRRDRVFAYGAYLDPLRAGTDFEDRPAVG